MGSIATGDGVLAREQHRTSVCYVGLQRIPRSLTPSLPNSNLIAEHIMMDAKSIVPTGWHFVSHFCEPDGMTKIVPLDRKTYPVRYYFIGFGSAYHIPPDQTPLVRDIGGGDDDVPELSTAKPYDPFKLDVYTLGNVFLKELYQVCQIMSRHFLPPDTRLTRNTSALILFLTYSSTCMCAISPSALMQLRYFVRGIGSGTPSTKTAWKCGA